MTSSAAALASAVALAIGLSATAANAQAQADVEQGKALFEGLCARCHGEGGTGAEGPNLNRPMLTRARDEAALRDIIGEGIADRGMPRVRRFTDTELTQLSAYVRSLGRTTAVPLVGNPTKGKELYARLGCRSCHIINGDGGSFGPELTDIGYARGPAYLRQALIDPAATLPTGQMPIPSRGFVEFLPVRVVTSDGREVRGARVNEDAFTIQLRDVNNRYYSFRKSNLELIAKEFDKSFMPTFKDKLSSSDADDLVAYLSGLRGAQ